MCSMTAVKYQRYGFVEMRPFLPGERRRACKEMERSMKGYKELQQEVAMLRRTISQQEKAKHGLEKTIKTSYYKSPVGTRSMINMFKRVSYVLTENVFRTTKASGGMFFIAPVARLGFFSNSKRV